MAQTVVLHIGAMKSGTSFLQQTLGSNRDELARQGFLFPGKTWRKQVLAVLDVLDQKRDGQVVPGTEGAWKRLIDEIAAWDSAALVSMEFLGPTSAPDIERILDDLAPADVHVVMTLRDLGRNLPAMWQEGLKNGTAWTWPEYLDDVRGGPSKKGQAKRFWRHMNYPFIAGKWAEAVGRNNLTLVTVPHPGAPPRLLWERFCSVVGLDPEPFDISGRSNTSLGAASAQVLRALNAELGDDIALSTYQKVVKHTLAKQHLSALAVDEDPIGFSEEWVRERAAAQIERLRDLDVPIVGDLDELRPVAAAGVDPTEVSAEQQLAAAVSSLAYLVRVWPSP